MKKASDCRNGEAGDNSSVKLLSNHAKRITDPMFDVCCDESLSCGQTLLVLKMAKKVLDIEIAHWEETVERQTGHREGRRHNRKGGK